MSDSTKFFKTYGERMEHIAIVGKKCLKGLGSKPIETAIEKALLDLTEYQYAADIISIDFEAPPTTSPYETVEIKLRLSKKEVPFNPEENA